MKIAPIDISHKTFSSKMMGFNPQDVMEFLREVADEMESLIRSRNDLKEIIRTKDLNIAEFRDRDDLLKQTITTATKMSENLHKEAEREAKIIINDAEYKAELIVADARDSLKKIYEEISTLKRVRLQFENNMKALVQSHLTMLDQAQNIMPNPEEIAGETTDQYSNTEDSIRSQVQNAIERQVEV